MNEKPTRSTIYFEPEIHHALRVKAANAHQSISEVVNEAVRLALGEDAEDLGAFGERAGEPTLSHEALLKYLKSQGKV
jgi:Arc/MetJ-type ribon-helix-helix transcriptional regulator